MTNKIKTVGNTGNRFSMKRYQLVFSNGRKDNDAGYKAPQDVTITLSDMGFEKIDIDVGYREARCKAGVFLYYLKAVFQWLGVLRRIKRNSVVFIQTPTGGGVVRDYVLKKLKKKKEARIITLFHDVEALRGLKNKGEDRFFDLILELSDGIIVHNSRMKEWFVNEKLFKKDIVCLDIFDYLYTPKAKNRKPDKQVIIAGNLNPDKAQYIRNIKDIGISFVLYGPGYDASISGENITYKGSFPPDDLPQVLADGFGLIWDGNSIDTCSGMFGEYLKFNNPHKLSLYLAAGLPVFIWKNAAEAEFVERNGVGYSVSSLSDIPGILESITEEEYNALLERVDAVSAKLISGAYTKNAVTALLSKLEEMCSGIS